MEGISGIVRATVERRHSNERLDGFLASTLKGMDDFSALSREKVKKGVLEGLVSVNGSTESDPRRKLRFGDIVESRILPEQRSLTPDVGMDPRVIFEDRHIVVIDKPAGMKMHPVSWDETGTVANWILAEYPEISGVGEDQLRPGIVHRLDRNTSGIVVIARTRESYGALKEIFQDHRMEKTYLALLLGHVTENSGEIAFPLAERRGTLKRIAVRHPDTFLGRMREALTRYRLRARFADHDLVEVMPQTGRTHQIRAHFAAIGAPVAGDYLYGGKRMKGSGLPARQLLHASRLAFSLFGEEYVFESPLPDDFTDFLSSIDPAVFMPEYPESASDTDPSAETSTGA
jgi:23S rRNA pseudouridine1911/1915/1917 synthase